MAKKKEKRKPRDIEQKKLDLSKPIGIEKFGSKDDPCFGKLYDARTDECSRCGDCELCAIALGQFNHVLRAKEESNKSYKDVEETQIKPDKDIKAIRKGIRKRIREMVKRGGGKEIDIELVVDDVFASYSKDGFMKSKIRKMIKSTASKSGVITLYKNKLAWIK